MKLKTTRSDLLDTLQIVGRALSTRSAMPALGGILVDAQMDSVSFRATDLSMGITANLDAQVETPGTLLLPGRLLLDLARALPDGEVIFDGRTEQRDLELTAGSGSFHIKTLAADDFPRLPEAEGDPIRMPAQPFAETIDRVAKAASNDEVRPILTGILVTAEGSTLTMVATDSYRLAVKHTELEAAVSTDVEATVPARALRELARLVEQAGEAEIQIRMLGNQIVFELPSAVLSSRLIDGQFPSYKQLLPDSFEHELTLPREELLEIARRVRHLAQRNTPLKVSLAEGELTISAETPDIGDASESMPAPYEGELFEIAFNPQFFIEGIESVEGDEIVLRLTSPLRPGLLQQTDGEHFSYLAMPIRLSV